MCKQQDINFATQQGMRFVYSRNIKQISSLPVWKQKNILMINVSSDKHAILVSIYPNKMLLNYVLSG